MRRHKDSKSNICTECVDVYVAGISVEVSAHYPGRSAALSETTMGNQASVLVWLGSTGSVWNVKSGYFAG